MWCFWRASAAASPGARPCCAGTRRLSPAIDRSQVCELVRRRLVGEPVSQEAVVREEPWIGVLQPRLVVAQVEPEGRLHEWQPEEVGVCLRQIARLGAEAGGIVVGCVGVSGPPK